MDRALNPFGAGAAEMLRPRDDRHSDTWAEEFVELADSARGDRFSCSVAPWLRPVMRAVDDNSNRVVVFMAAVGCGKTAMFEALVAHKIAADPGGVLATLQTNKHASEWVESRLLPVLEKCAPIKPLMPADRHKIRKDCILFPHMPVYVGGPGLSNLQSRSMRWVLSDEVWLWPPGRVEEAERRLHDRWNARLVLVSQGGAAEGEGYESNRGNSDLDAAWNLTDKRVFSWVCPECAAVKPWEWDDVIYEGGAADSAERDWAEIRESAGLICRKCETRFPDEVSIRRGLAEGSRYVATNDKGIPGQVGFRFPAVAAWFVPWGQLAVEWVKANDLLRFGNATGLRQFIQKRLAEPWREELELGAGEEFVGADYVKADVAGGEPIEGEVRRAMTVDVQDAPYRHFWYVVRAWRADGSSRLIAEGKLETWEMIDAVARQNKINPNPGDKLVFIDGQFATEEVYQEAAKRGNWVVLHGSGRDSFPNRRMGRDGHSRTVWEVFTLIKRRKALGRLVPYVLWAVNPVKDVLARLKSGAGVAWEAPADVSEDYRQHLRGEVKRDIVDRRTKAVKRRWVRVRENHMWDCEAMLVVVSMMLGIVPTVEVEESEAEESDG